MAVRHQWTCYLLIRQLSSLPCNLCYLMCTLHPPTLHFGRRVICDKSFYHKHLAAPPIRSTAHRGRDTYIVLTVTCTLTNLIECFHVLSPRMGDDADPSSRSRVSSLRSLSRSGCTDPLQMTNTSDPPHMNRPCF